MDGVWISFVIPLAFFSLFSFSFGFGFVFAFSFTVKGWVGPGVNRFKI